MSETPSLIVVVIWICAAGAGPDGWRRGVGRVEGDQRGTAHLRGGMGSELSRGEMRAETSGRTLA